MAGPLTVDMIQAAYWPEPQTYENWLDHLTELRDAVVRDCHSRLQPFNIESLEDMHAEDVARLAEKTGKVEGEDAVFFFRCTPTSSTWSASRTATYLMI